MSKPIPMHLMPEFRAFIDACNKTLPDNVEFVFKMVEVSPFYIRFDLWTRNAQADTEPSDT